MARTLIIIGLIFIAAGILWPLVARSGLGRLPGDIFVERGSFRFYFPPATSILISVVISLMLWLFNR